MAYRIEYSPESEDHLRALAARQQAAILDGVVLHLSHKPTTQTRNRKPLRPNPLAPWELRIGDLRVYYDVEESPDAVVRVIAVGTKTGNVVRIGKDVVNL